MAWPWEAVKVPELSSRNTARKKPRMLPFLMVTFLRLRPYTPLACVPKPAEPPPILNPLRSRFTKSVLMVMALPLDCAVLRFWTRQ